MKLTSTEKEEHIKYADFLLNVFRRENGTALDKFNVENNLTVLRNIKKYRNNPAILQLIKERITLYRGWAKDQKLLTYEMHIIETSLETIRHTSEEYRRLG